MFTKKVKLKHFVTILYLMLPIMLIQNQFHQGGQKMCSKWEDNTRVSLVNNVIIISFSLFHSATGREVFDWILDQGYYSERDTSNVVRQVLEAVAYLHSLRIVHRNLKVTSCRSAGVQVFRYCDDSLLL